MPRYPYDASRRLPRNLQKILQAEREMREDRNGWIFPSRYKDSGSGHRGPARMDNAFRDTVIHAALDSELVTPHVMRHTAVTKLAQPGIDLPTIQHISGHKTVATVLRYTHVHGQHIDQGIRALGRTLPEPSTNETGRTITQELHTGARGAPAAKRSESRKDV
jgi:site-specific recombinase XerD